MTDGCSMGDPYLFRIKAAIEYGSPLGRLSEGLRGYGSCRGVILLLLGCFGKVILAENILMSLTEMSMIL